MMWSVARYAMTSMVEIPTPEHAAATMQTSEREPKIGRDVQKSQDLQRVPMNWSD